MLRKTIPLLLTFLMGMFAIFLTLFPVPKLEEIASKWVMIITAFSIFLGIASLLKVNFVKIQKGQRDSFFAFILLVGFVTTTVLGIVGGVGEQFVPRIDEAITSKVTTYTVGESKELKTRTNDKIMVLDADKKELGIMTIKEAIAKAKTAKAHLVEVNPNADTPICMIDPNYTGSWTDIFKNKCYYVFTHIIRPMQSTMFSLLAFFVASAAFRAFRVKNFEATVLLISAFLVMLGRVPIGGVIWSGFPVISKWIMETINMAGSRAITFGTAIGIIAVSLKIMLGIERGYLGGSD